MRVVFGADERTELTDTIQRELEARGHDLTVIGPPGGDDGADWITVGRAAGEAVARGEAETAVVGCWTGTGVSIAANKVPGARAALCTDAATASGARRWNDANVLAISLRLTSETVAREILDAWFDTAVDPAELERLRALESSS